MKSRIARTGPALTLTVCTIGVATAFPVALVTPPLSGGTLTALLIAAFFGFVAIRVLHVKQLKARRSDDPLEYILARLDDVLEAEGIR